MGICGQLIVRPTNLVGSTGSPLGIWLIVALLDCLIALSFKRHDPWFMFYPAAVPFVRASLSVGESCAVGFSEELAMRAYLIPRFEAITGSTWKSVLLSSAFFGFVHLNKRVRRRHLCDHRSNCFWDHVFLEPPDLARSDCPRSRRLYHSHPFGGGCSHVTDRRFVGPVGARPRIQPPRIPCSGCPWSRIMRRWKPNRNKTGFK